jgi:CO/xanthine dehydrogenase Mo-binding subunit
MAESSTPVQDAGKAVHPRDVAGQRQGRAGQGMGGTLNEAYVFNDRGQRAHPTCLD